MIISLIDSLSQKNKRYVKHISIIFWKLKASSTKPRIIPIRIKKNTYRIRVRFPVRRLNGSK
jgi:hypothetical protein